MTWHVTDELWRAYIAGTADALLVDAVDAHVQGCPRCRESARSYVDRSEVDLAWQGVAARVSAPRLRVPLRLLPDRHAVPLAASALGLPWSVAVGTAVVAAVIAGLWPARSTEVFVFLAPLIPVLSVVAAFDAGDPLRGLVATTPFSKLRLAMLRATAALAVAVPVTFLVGLLVPALTPIAFVWLLPALALTSGTLLLLTWLTAWPAAGIVAAGWALAVGLLTGPGDIGVLAAEGGQFAAAVLAVVGGTLFVLRTSTTRLEGGY